MSKRTAPKRKRCTDAEVDAMERELHALREAWLLRTRVPRVFRWCGHNGAPQPPWYGAGFERASGGVIWSVYSSPVFVDDWLLSMRWSESAAEPGTARDRYTRLLAEVEAARNVALHPPPQGTTP